MFKILSLTLMALSITSSSQNKPRARKLLAERVPFHAKRAYQVHLHNQFKLLIGQCYVNGPDRQRQVESIIMPDIEKSLLDPGRKNDLKKFYHNLEHQWPLQ